MRMPHADAQSALLVSSLTCPHLRHCHAVRSCISPICCRKLNKLHAHCLDVQQEAASFIPNSPLLQAGDSKGGWWNSRHRSR